MKIIPISKSSVDEQKSSTFNTIRMKSFHRSKQNGTTYPDFPIHLKKENDEYFHSSDTNLGAAKIQLDTDEIKHLYELFAEFSNEFSQRSVLKKVKTILKSYLKFTGLRLELRDEKIDDYKTVMTAGLNIPSILINEQKKRHDQDIYIPDIPEFRNSKSKKVFSHQGCLLIKPILLKKHAIVGYLTIYSKKIHAFSEKELFFLDNLTTHLGQILAKINEFEQFQQQSITDSLTQIPNRRFFDNQLSHEIERAHRYNHPLTLLMIDIDHFKKYNDKYGHPVGDIALKNVVRCLQKILRKGDFLARYGGEEFMVILPETAKKQGFKVAEKLRLAVEKSAQQNSDSNKTRKLTISIGIASLPEDSAEISVLIKMVDQALYWAKSQGRNRTGDIALITNKIPGPSKSKLKIID